MLSPPSLISLHRNLPDHVAGIALAPRVSARLCDFEEIHMVILMTVFRFPSDTKRPFLVEVDYLRRICSVFHIIDLKA